MSQEHPFGNSGAEHHPEPNHPQPTEEVAVAVPIPNRFWRMMTDLGFPSPASNPAPFVVTVEAFLGLTSQVQALAVAEARAASPALTPAQSQSRSYDPIQTGPDFDALSSDIADSLREQVRQVHQRLDEVQKEVLKSRGEIGESSKGGSPFTPEIQGKSLPATFRLPTLESYDGSGDPTEHTAAFCTQMALYDMSDALMSSARPKPTTASLLGLVQGGDEPLSQFMGWFTSQVQGIPDLHPSLVIQAFLTGLRPSRFFWSLIEQPPATLPNMLQWAHQYMVVETLVAGKRDETKRPRVEQPQGHPPPSLKRREDRSGMLPARPPLDSPQFSLNRHLLSDLGDGSLKGPEPNEVTPRATQQKKVLSLS
ncbi:hypothetical protein B296_00048198 [Ensete ventricosum]|uniref:Retrotransposon gag domain-containing protein n=1 Tax=Ensete ventricosum TaxID=4639 RepID=A0A426WXR6_ENSVE|nr:hypothetical protein B296_00048198 [Ensete ventricosum]